MIVVDTNVIAYLFLGGDHTAHARETFLKDPRWAVPMLWRSEFCNVLAAYIRKNRLSQGDALEVFQRAERLLRHSQYQVRPENVLELVVASRCSAYDCEFVSLALELQVPLVTTDRLILTEFPKVAVSPELFSQR